MFQRGEVNLENVTHEEAVATLKATQERVILVVAKPDSAFSAPPSDTSHSPQLRKFFHLFLYPKVELHLYLYFRTQDTIK